MNVTPLVVAMSKTFPSKQGRVSKAVFSDTPEYLELLMGGWSAVQYDGAVMADENGVVFIRQVVHLEKSVPLVDAAREWLAARGLTPPEPSR